jgi:hypothetical protein
MDDDDDFDFDDDSMASYLLASTARPCALVLKKLPSLFYW